MITLNPSFVVLIGRIGCFMGCVFASSVVLVCAGLPIATIRRTVGINSPTVMLIQ